MSNRKYPRLGSTWFYKKKSLERSNEECIACDKKAVGKIEVQESYMRGEDEVHPGCRRHIEMARKNFDQFYAHACSKEKFLESKSEV